MSNSKELNYYKDAQISEKDIADAKQELYKWIREKKLRKFKFNNTPEVLGSSLEDFLKKEFDGEDSVLKNIKNYFIKKCIIPENVKRILLHNSMNTEGQPEFLRKAKLNSEENKDKLLNEAIKKLTFTDGYCPVYKRDDLDGLGMSYLGINYQEKWVNFNGPEENFQKFFRLRSNERDLELNAGSYLTFKIAYCLVLQDDNDHLGEEYNCNIGYFLPIYYHSLDDITIIDDEARSRDNVQSTKTTI